MAEPAYRVHVDERQWERLRKSAPRAVLDAAEALRDGFLAHTPEDRLTAGGRLKKLKGDYEGYLQYDLPGFYRLWYTVDRARKIVRVEYIGPHP